MQTYINTIYKEISNMEKYKPYLANGLFLLCLTLSAYEVHKINDIFSDEMKSQLQSTEFTDKLSLPENSVYQKTEITLSYSSQAIQRMINLVFYLFLGGLIYAKTNGLSKE